MRIVFMGTPDFALPSLRLLMEQRYPVAAVVTVPDKPQGRGREIRLSAVKKFALQHQLLVLQPADLKDPAFVSSLRSLEPDLVVVVAFRILPKEVYTIPPLGAFNLHASLLPKYRGAAPISWAIINGETETGVTTFFLQEKVDTGSVILQARVKIGPDETAGELHDKLAEVGAEIVLQTVRLIELGKVAPRMQQNQFATSAPKIFKEDCRIVWTNAGPTVHNFVRGLSPSPCAWTMHNGTLLKVYRTRLQRSMSADPPMPGSVVAVDKKSLCVAAKNDAISILEIQQEGKKRLGIEEFLRGYTIHLGDVFA